MQRVLSKVLDLTLVATSLVIVGCGGAQTDEGQTDTTAQSSAGGAVASGATTGAAGASAQPAVADMRLEVDVNARQLKVFQGGRQIATHAVAVGSQEWPTRTGEWTVTQVVWNPDWNPPDESWAEEREPRESGDPKNPMGRAQLVYDPPRSIHGTNQPSSIGKPVSHGSIRLPNEVITQLARQVMEAAGVGKDEAWYRRVQQNRTEKVVVDLPRPVPIRVY